MGLFSKQPKRQEVTAYAEKLQPNGATPPRPASYSEGYLRNVAADLEDAERTLETLETQRTATVARLKDIDEAMKEIKSVIGFLSPSRDGLAKVAAQKAGNIEGKTLAEAAENVKGIAAELDAEGEKMEKARKAAH